MAAVVALLDADLQQVLAKIAREGRGPFAARSTQSLFDEALPALEAFYEIGAEHDNIADLFAELGIRDPRGRALSRGTVSSAVYRARLKHGAHSGNRPAPTHLRRVAGAPVEVRGAASPSDPPSPDPRARAGPRPPAIPPQHNDAASLATAAAFIHQLRDQYDD